MGVVQLTNQRRVLAVVAVALLWLVGCATGPDIEQWPHIEAQTQVPDEAPGEPTLQRGDDGLWYAVGEFEPDVQPGDVVFGRYAGEWPLDERASPALFYGRVVEQHSEQVVRIHPSYEFPDIEHDELRVEIGDDLDGETMGKGVAQIEGVDHDQMTYLQLSVSPEHGARAGDAYAVLDAPGGGPDAQLTRRFQGVCMVVSVGEESAQCRVHRGHPDHPGADAAFEKGQQAVFLEPTYGEEPRDATVLVAPVDDDELNDRMVERIEEYLSRFPGGNVDVEMLDETVDATDEAFHRWHRRIDTGGTPKVLLGASLHDEEGDERLVLNYTGLDTATGPGMVAAPPEGGVDMGPPDRIDDEQWRAVGAVLMGAVMVYRGQTAEALGHLHSALQDPGLDGKWRWHTRDQYAMRWAGLDRYAEAMWLVNEDEATAADADDDQALYNAIGTRARLHDYVDQPTQALKVAQRYLDYRRDDRPSTGYLSAIGMFAEMAVQAEEIEQAEEKTEELIELCPDGCQGDATSLLAGIYWAATDRRPELQDRATEKMVAYGEAEEHNSLATARMFQGWTFMRDDDFDQALIAFLEAERLFTDREDSPYGAARAQFYISIAQVVREEPQQAFDYGMEARDYMHKIGDFTSVARIYERLAELYISPDTEGPPQGFLAAGSEVMQSAVYYQLAKGDYGRAAEAGFGHGNYLFRAGRLEQARAALQQSVTRALRVARFDMVAMNHMFLALLARMEGDLRLYEEEMERAELMAEIADDPYIDELLEELQAPPEEPPPDDDPTQLL